MGNLLVFWQCWELPYQRLLNEFIFLDTESKSSDLLGDVALPECLFKLGEFEKGAEFKIFVRFYCSQSKANAS